MKLSDLKKSISEKSLSELQADLEMIRGSRRRNAMNPIRAAKTKTKKTMADFMSSLSSEEAAKMLEMLQNG